MHFCFLNKCILKLNGCKHFAYAYFPQWLQFSPVLRGSKNYPRLVSKNPRSAYSTRVI